MLPDIFLGGPEDKSGRQVTRAAARGGYFVASCPVQVRDVSTFCP